MGNFTETGSEGWDDGVPSQANERHYGVTAATELDVRRARLVRTIEGEIVPRLILTRAIKTVRNGVPPTKPVLDAADVKELVRLLLAHDVGVSSAYVATVRQRGAGLDAICLELLAPAARELGLLWEEDECDFMQVTVGLCRLHQLLRELSPEFQMEEIPSSVERRVLLAPIPGEQHTFGITVVAQFLRRAGWDVWHEFPSSDAEILEIVRHNWFAVVGLSIGNEARVHEVAAFIAAIRAVSRNRSVGILIGGPVLVAKPELVSLTGADAMAVDGQQATLHAEFVRSGSGATR